VASDSEKIAELTALAQAVRDKVRARYPQPGDRANGSGESSSASLHGNIQIAIADLMPAVHARDAAQARIASIGSVNPRAGGLANNLIQAGKKSIARALGWFVRDQVVFNREAVSTMEALMEALNDHNRILLSLAGQANENVGYVRAEIAARTAELGGRLDDMDALREEARELKDVRKHWAEWRQDWEQKLATNEIQFLRAAADLQGAFQHRVTQMEANFRDIAKMQHADYLGALDRTTEAIHKQLFADFEKMRAEFAKSVNAELRLIRQRTGVRVAAPAAAPDMPAPSVRPSSQNAAIVGLDYARFAERFRGDEADVIAKQQFYVPYFTGRRKVLDIGCGRGELLQIMRDIGAGARGIDLDSESVAVCQEKGFTAETADLFPYLASHSEAEFDGIISSQVVEHIDPARLPEMIRLCASRLEPGGILAIETPNPECLAIFATHFYLDPTHIRPVPYKLLQFYMEEAGLVNTEIHTLSPAIDETPELRELPDGFRARFFGGLDYAIIGRKSPDVG
jgi:O-antigen chain-terminating methyltransferase